MYDLDRNPIENIPGLCGRGTGGGMEEWNEEHKDSACKYFHIHSCGPGELVDLDGGFAKRLYDHCVKQALKPPKGEVEFPIDWVHGK